MTKKPVDLKDYIRNLINSLPKNRNRDKPIICLEFKGKHSPDFGSRIAIYRVESLRILWYKFANPRRGDVQHLKDWTIEDSYWQVVNIVPPEVTRAVITSSLPIIQVVPYNA